MKMIKIDRPPNCKKKLEKFLSSNMVLIISLFVVLGCSKSDNVYDSSYVLGTMEAKINDELIVFDDASGISGSFDLEYSCFELYIGIQGYTNSETPYPQHSIGFYLIPTQGVGTYDGGANYHKNDSRYEFTAYHKQPGFSACLDVPTDYMEEGEVTIISVDNGRYKGIFHFTAYSCDGEKVVITDGKFDVAQESELERFCN